MVARLAGTAMAALVITVLLGAIGRCDAATIRALPLPSGATIDPEAYGAVVNANAHGDVAATVQLGAASSIITWDGFGRRSALKPPKVDGNGDEPVPSTENGVVAPDGTVYGAAVYPFTGAYTGERTQVYGWRVGRLRKVDGLACAGPATDVLPTAVSRSGRLALAGHYSSTAVNMDAVEAGLMPPTASVRDGAVCHALDRGWISALDGDFAAGRRGYRNGKLLPRDVDPNTQTYVAVRWKGRRAFELGPGVALAVNAKGDCAGSDALPGIPRGGIHAIVWHAGVMTRLTPRNRRSIAYAISETGRTVVGTLWDADGQHAVRWRDGNVERAR